MVEYLTCDAVDIVEELALPRFLWATFFDLLIKSIYWAKKNIFSQVSVLVLILVL